MDDRPIVAPGRTQCNPRAAPWDDQPNLLVEVDIKKRIQRCRGRAPMGNTEAAEAAGELTTELPPAGS